MRFALQKLDFLNQVFVLGFFIIVNQLNNIELVLSFVYGFRI